MTLTVELGTRRMKRQHRISKVVPGERLCWTIESALPWFIRGERCQLVEPNGTGGTLYRNIEEVHGVVGPLVGLFFSPNIRAGLEGLGAALKARVENPAEVSA